MEEPKTLELNKELVSCASIKDDSATIKFSFNKIENGVIKHNRPPLIIDVFITNARNPHKGEATHG